MFGSRVTLLLTLLMALPYGFVAAQQAQHQPAAANHQPIPVKVQQHDSKWQLTRAGKPYFIKGAGGDSHLKLLAEKGGNSIRTWGVGAETQQLLDKAYANGLSVTVGIWLEHASNGYDYDDYEQVSDQIAKALAAVRKYKNHPAVLMWGIGNEMEGYESGDNPAIWHHVDHLCRLIKQEDPHHPTMTVIAEIGGNRVAAIHRFCPNVDIIGINSYGGAPSLPQRYRETGGTKPYVVTEFGPVGQWEVGRDANNAVMEPFSNQKADHYRASYESLTADKTNCLGAYSFLWGQKMEATTTWFGMLLEDGRPTNAVDTMTELWTGNQPNNHAPVVESFTCESGLEVEAGAELVFRLKSSDPDNDEITVEWSLRPEADAYITAGDFKPNPAPIENAFASSDTVSATVKAPAAGGLFRVYAVVADQHNSVATASIPFKVKYQPLEQIGAKATLPCVVYDDEGSSKTFSKIVLPDNVTRTGKDSELNLAYPEQPKFGMHCIRWAPNNSASNPTTVALNCMGGFADLTGAKRLTFWAKGTTGKERLVVGIGAPAGGHENDVTFAKSKTVSLTKHWKKFQIDFANADLRKIRSGFLWSVEPTGEATEIFIDKIEFE